MSHLGISVQDVEEGTQDIHLDETNNLALVNDAGAVAQHAKQRLMTFHGEWFLNDNVGVRWLNDIFAQAFSPAISESIIKASIRGTDGVTGISTFSVGFINSIRNLSASAITVETIYDDEVSL